MGRRSPGTDRYQIWQCDWNCWYQQCTYIIDIQPSYLLNVQFNRTTRSSNIITLQRPPVRSRLKVTNRYFTHHAPVLWKSLPKQLPLSSAPPSHGTANDSTPPLALSSHMFHSVLFLTILSSLVFCINSCRFSGYLTWLTVFILQSFFSLCRSFSPRSSTQVSVNKPPSVLADWHALCRHCKSPHISLLIMLSWAIINTYYYPQFQLSTSIIHERNNTNRRYP